ncbi:unnamed protein product [Protopolystoma xenopodis]|uniref:Uncharacterized protein n=1 Tax=Protopolystoma xenopodis TaxID=117903 RepID=A0A3S5FBT5_9PLAT|nr:unnamed protein product [Protopolystoma xenopodis]
MIPCGYLRQTDNCVPPLLTATTTSHCLFLFIKDIRKTPSLRLWKSAEALVHIARVVCLTFHCLCMGFIGLGTTTSGSTAFSQLFILGLYFSPHSAYPLVLRSHFFVFPIAFDPKFLCFMNLSFSPAALFSLPTSSLSLDYIIWPGSPTCLSLTSQTPSWFSALESSFRNRLLTPNSI